MKARNLAGNVSPGRLRAFALRVYRRRLTGLVMARRTAIQISRDFFDLVMFSTNDVVVIGDGVVELLKDGQ